MYNKVILLIEGIDHFIDYQTEMEAVVAFWLPKYFPDKIRVIVTADQGSEALNYFKRIECEILNIPIDTSIIQDVITSHTSKTHLISEELKNKHLAILSSYTDKTKSNLFVKTFLTFFLPEAAPEIINKGDVDEQLFEKLYKNIDEEKLRSITDIQELFEFSLDQIGCKIMDSNKFKKLLMTFNLSQKGLTYEELTAVTNISAEEGKLFIGLFKNFLIKYQGLWILNNDMLKKTIQAKCMNNQEEINQLHEEIANTIEKITQNSIRKLEEQTYHLYKSGSYFKLKEIISAIENFLLLFNPNNKYDLCRYWQKLEENGFDPVTEYNKAIEGFEMHYHPNSEDVFRIIVQTSRFLKEFSDFETYFTPQFRHPPIEGNFDELNDVGLLREIIDLKIFSSKECDDKQLQERLEKIQNKGTCEKIKEKMDSKKEVMIKTKRKDPEEIKQSLKKKRDAQKQQDNDQNAEKSKAQQQKMKTQTLPKIQDKKNERLIRILKDYEAINVDIPVNRQKFRNEYIK